MSDYEKAMGAMMRLNDLMGENVPEDQRTDRAAGDIWTMFSVIEDHKRKSEEITTLRQRVKDCEGAIERREQMLAEAEARTEPEIAAFQAAAVLICQQEADEWDSDRLQTYKNYAQACGQRIAKLTPIDVQAWLLRRQSEAVTAAYYAVLDDLPDAPNFPHCRMVLNSMDKYAHRLRNEADEINQEG